MSRVVNQGLEVRVGSAEVGPLEANATLGLLRGAGIVLAGSALIAICAHVSIPLWFTPIPVTLQPFAVVLLGLLLSPRLAFGTMVAYLVEGAAGLPVFTPHGPGGAAQLLGPTGGYLMSYPVVAPMVAWTWRRSSQQMPGGLVAAGLGSLLILSMGAAWLAIWTHAAAGLVLKQAVLPFLPGDALKTVAAAGIAVGLARWRRRS